ncbi:MAG: cell envelope integrity protein CreD [Dongiaceae bacterium]
MADHDATAPGEVRPEPMPAQPSGLYAALTRGALPRLLFLGLLVVLLAIPLGMVRYVLDDRTGRQWEVETLIAEQWGAEQTIAGPVIRVPYIETVTVTRNNEPIVQERRHMLEFLPNTLSVDTQIATETRGKGPYRIPVYGAEVALRAGFALPDLAALGIENVRFLWDEAVVAVAIADPSALRGATIRIDGNGGAVEPGFAPGTSGVAGFHAGFDAARNGGFGETRNVFVSLRFNGMASISTVPLGAQTSVHIAGDWPHPNFDGSFLPIEREITATGFDARWEVASLARVIPSAMIDGSVVTTAMQGYATDRLGVRLETPIDVYAQVDRVLKYGIVVIGLTFAAIFVVGVLRNLRAHAVQYLLVGGSITLFYLMLLALAEHVAFPIAYAAAALLDLAAVALYVGRTVSRMAGMVVALLLGLVRGFMYLLLQQEDLSLLIGSLGLFLALAAVMYATRNVDWYRLGLPTRSPGSHAVAGMPASA